MLEKDIIQYRGFRNTVDADGNVVGFEFRIRSPYYRGLWLSQIRVGRVIVDGEEFLVDSGKFVWEINGKDFTPAEMAQENKVHWAMTETATIKVKKPGGLAQGWHEVKVRWSYSSSYMPPSMETFDESVEQGGRRQTTYSRTMLIV